MAAFAGLDRGFVDAVELEQAAELGPHLLFDVPVPPVGGQAVGTVRGLVERDVVGAFQPDDVIALELVARVAASGGFFVQGDVEFAERVAQGIKVADLRLDGREVTHWWCLLSLVRWFGFSVGRVDRTE